MAPRKARPAAPALLLFDIDGTLIRRAGPHHRQALVEAIRRVTGLETTTDSIPVHGMLDPDIITEMMRRAGASKTLIRGAMPRIVETAQSVYVKSCPRLERKVCPGVRRLLARMRKRDVAMALLTGNLTRIGWKKMEQAGLKDYFCFGVFGEMGRTRAALIRAAIRHARKEGIIGASSRVILIGDAQKDIEAAQANKIPVIAVATGVTPAEQLACFSPDFLVEDLRELDPDMIF